MGADTSLLAVVFLTAAVFLRAFGLPAPLGIEGVGGGSGFLSAGLALAETALSGNGTLASCSRSSTAINLRVNFFRRCLQLKYSL